VFVGVRTKDTNYIEYVDGEREIYDLVKDPHELDDLGAKADEAVSEQLRAWTHALAGCHGHWMRVVARVEEALCDPSAHHTQPDIADLSHRCLLSPRAIPG